MDARFIPNASLTFHDYGGFPFELAKSLKFASKRLARGKHHIIGRIITVPAGFRTDLASIPRILWAILPPIGRYDAAAVLHDYLYQHNGVSRREADAVLLEAMRVLNVRVTQRWVIYVGVRLGGWVTWNKYRRRDTYGQSQ